MAKKAVRATFTLGRLAETFGIERTTECGHLQNWLNAKSELTAFQTELFNDIYKKSADEGNYWNAEELKIEMIGFLFYLADINVPKQVKVFYERAIASIVDGHSLSVTADCLIARPLQFNEPSVPYYFYKNINQFLHLQLGN